MIWAIIQARLGSSRLPEKVLMNFCDKPDIEHVIRRVQVSKQIDRIIMVTTTEVLDDRLFEFCKENKVRCFRGSTDDVLDRYYQSALHFGLNQEDGIVRITGDCPLIDPYVIDKVIGVFKKSKADYVSNTNPPTYPDGLDTEVFTLGALRKAWEEAKLLSEREHVTPYIKKNPDIFHIRNVENKIDLSNHRWTLDEKEDYEMIRCIYENLYNENKLFTTDDVLAFLNQNPKVQHMNEQFQRDEGYMKSLEMDKQRK